MFDEDKFDRRRNKSMKKKDTYAKNGSYSQKHLRLCEELRINRVNVSKKTNK